MKYRRFNINIDDSVSDLDAAIAVLRVIAGGRISGYPVEDTYCYLTAFEDGTRVSAGRTRAGNDVFHVYREDVRDE